MGEKQETFQSVLDCSFCMCWSIYFRLFWWLLLFTIRSLTRLKVVGSWGWIMSPCRDLVLEMPIKLNPPKNSLGPKSTLILSLVQPWDLWIVTAWTSMSGICFLLYISPLHIHVDSVGGIGTTWYGGDECPTEGLCSRGTQHTLLQGVKGGGELLGLDCTGSSLRCQGCR